MNKGEVFTDGQSYERMRELWSRFVGVRILDWLGIPNDLRWLDVGCGNGAFTEEIIGVGQQPSPHLIPAKINLRTHEPDTEQSWPNSK